MKLLLIAIFSLSTSVFSQVYYADYGCEELIKTYGEISYSAGIDFAGAMAEFDKNKEQTENYTKRYNSYKSNQTLMRELESAAVEKCK